MNNLFEAIGIVVCLIFIICLVMYISIFGAEIVAKFMHRRKIKHRFDGGPTAKCFCKDCKYYSEYNASDKYNYGSGTCNAHKNWGVADDWFCWNATPLPLDESKRREKLEKER